MEGQLLGMGLIASLSIIIGYFVMRIAVKHGTKDAMKDFFEESGLKKEYDLREEKRKYPNINK